MATKIISLQSLLLMLFKYLIYIGDEMTNVGQAAYELQKKSAEIINVIDMQREMQKKVAEQIEEIIKNHRDYAPEYYIVYMLQKNRVIPNCLKQFFITRKTRPVPNYDCSLFSYNNKKEELKFHWAIPDQDTCEYLLHNQDKLSTEEQELLQFVEKFASGTLV